MLTDMQIKAILPAENPKKYSDEKGLFLLVQPNGSRWWRFDYQLNGSRKTISFGVYPDVTLKKAREDRDAARTLVKSGADARVRKIARPTHSKPWHSS